MSRLFAALTAEVNRLAPRYGIVYALVFGSAATGHFKEYSDVDLAVKFSEGGSARFKAFELALDLEDALGLNVDVVPLNDADYVLRFEAFSTGVLVYCADRASFLEDKVNAFDLFHDFQPCFERFYRAAVEGIRGASSRD